MNIVSQQKYLKIQKIPFKERKKLVKELCLFYEMSKLKQKINKSFKDKNISLFEEILNKLNNEEKAIIKNCFLSNKKYHWTNSYFSKTTFYKKLHNAINKFLFFIYAS